MKLGVVGLGYVGVPFAVAAAESGISVLGVDIDQTKVEKLNGGLSPIDGLSHVEVVKLIRHGFRAFEDFQVIATCDFVVICVPTPLSLDGKPDMKLVYDAIRNVAQNLKKGATLVIESTSMPGTTEIVERIMAIEFGLRVDDDYFLGYSPERVDPGNGTFNLSNTPKIISGFTPRSLDRIREFYSLFVSQLVETSIPLHAELAKLFENTFRLVNISLVNELARECRRISVDVHQVLDLASSKPFGFMAFKPSLGAGGHCIPVDPNYLDHYFRGLGGRGLELVQVAHQINHSVSAQLADFLGALESSMAGTKDTDNKCTKVLLLGVSYKPNSIDARESAGLRAAQALAGRGFEVEVFDPLANPTPNDVRRVTFEEALTKSYDFVVLAQSHDLFKSSQFIENLHGWRARGATVIDATGDFREFDFLKNF